MSSDEPDNPDETLFEITSLEAPDPEFESDGEEFTIEQLGAAYARIRQDTGEVLAEPRSDCKRNCRGNEDETDH